MIPRISPNQINIILHFLKIATNKILIYTISLNIKFDFDTNLLGGNRINNAFLETRHCKDPGQIY